MTVSCFPSSEPDKHVRDLTRVDGFARQPAARITSSQENVTAITDAHAGKLHLTAQADGSIEVVSASIDHDDPDTPATFADRPVSDRERIKISPHAPIENARELIAFFWDEVNPRLHDRFLGPCHDAHLADEEIAFTRGDMSTLTEWTGRLIQTWLRWNRRATQSLGEYCTVIYRPVTDDVPGFNFAESSGLERAPFPIIKGLTLVGRESAFRGSYVRYNGGDRSRVSGHTRCSRTIEVKVPVSSHTQLGDGYLAQNALLVRNWLVKRGFHSSHVAAILGR